MIYPIEAEEFMELRKTLSVLDVRSPGEYEQGHIPRAVNLPLFDNEERSSVGTLYKNSGREAAIMEGLGFAGKKLQTYVKQARRHASSKKVLVHCWRGGMRSESIAWLLSIAGYDVYLLKGGYKAYRKYIRELWNRECNMIVLSGKTGTGKSELMRYLQQNGHQVLDLERAANHKGSAFGSMGESPQPTNEQFENNLADLWLSLDFGRPVWLEDESRFIGKVSIPEELYQQMQKAPAICLEIPKQLRIERLIKEYAGFPKELLTESIHRIGRRLGGQHEKAAVEAIGENDFARAIDIVLTYYDKTYSFDLQSKTSGNITFIESNTLDAEKNAMMILEQFRIKTLQ